MRNDVLAELAALDPVEGEELPDGHGPEADALLARILSEAPERGAPEQGAPEREDPERGTMTRVPSRRSLWLLLPAAAMLLGAAWLLTQPSSAPQEVNCYREAAVHADRAAIHADSGDWDPAGACERAWAAGELWDDPVPDALASCVTETGIVAVVPGAEVDTCAAMGWAALDAEGSPVEVVGLHEAIADHYRGGPCVPLEEAERLARGALVDSGLEGWEIVVAPSVSDDTECVSVAVDAQHQRLRVVPHVPPTD